MLFDRILHRSSGVLLAILAVCIFSSCGPIDRGLLLWSHDDASIPSGSIVNIFNESELRGISEIRYRDADSKMQRVELESWKIRTAQSTAELERIQAEYTNSAPYFGIAEIQALPVRDAMATDISTSIVYRMTLGEKVKILNQSETEVEVGNLKDYWFEVLTADGTRGYVFGYRLDKVDASGVSVEEKDDSIDEFLAQVINNEWRPEYFQWMIDDGAYNLTRFRDEYRFYHDNESARFILNTEKHNLVFEYEELFLARYKEYLAIGSNLHIIVYDDDRIAIQYDFDNKAVSESLVRLNENISVQQIIEDEQSRRDTLRENFLLRGNRLSSSRYGNISFDDSGNGIWRAYQTYGVTIFPEWFTGSFQLSFPLYITESLAEQYAGALTFTQAGQSLRNSMNFLYSYINNGLQLEFVPQQNIEGTLVVRRTRNPVIIFFTFSRQ